MKMSCYFFLDNALKSRNHHQFLSIKPCKINALNNNYSEKSTKISHSYFSENYQLIEIVSI